MLSTEKERKSPQSGWGQAPGQALLVGQSSGLEGKTTIMNSERNWCCSGNWVSQSLWSQNQPASISIHHLLLLQQWVSKPFSSVSMFYTLHPLAQSGSSQQACSRTRDTSRKQVSLPLSEKWGKISTKPAHKYFPDFNGIINQKRLMQVFVKRVLKKKRLSGFHKFSHTWLLRWHQADISVRRRSDLIWRSCGGLITLT